MTKEGYFTVIAISSWPDPNPGVTRAVKTNNECGVLLDLPGVLAEDPDFCVDDSPTCTGATCICLGNAHSILAGTVVIYDVVGGAAAYAYNMTALADFTPSVITGVGLGEDDPPTFSDCINGLDGVNYILTKESLIALYDIEDCLSGQSDVIITFPTKTQTITAGAGVQNPFQGVISLDGCSWGVPPVYEDPCERVEVALWDDEENSPGVTHGFSPTTTSVLKLCNEVNYITIGEGAASLLDTELLQFKLGESGFDIGWINFDFTVHNQADRFIQLPATGATEDATVTNGLPVIGYELGSFIEGFYGHMLPLRYTSDITAPAS
jgi:hypothetical protein